MKRRRSKVKCKEIMTLSHSHTCILAHSHTRTIARSHTRTPAHFHTLTLAHSYICTISHLHLHTRTLSHCHTLTLAHLHLHTRTLAHSHTCTLVHLHTCTLAHFYTFISVTFSVPFSLLLRLYYYSVLCRNGKDYTGAAGVVRKAPRHYVLRWREGNSQSRRYGIFFFTIFLINLNFSSRFIRSHNIFEVRFLNCFFFFLLRMK